MKNDLNTLLDVVIFKEEDGTYSLFNKYYITKEHDNEYSVQSYNTALHLTFNTLRTATTWCVLDKQQKFNDAKQVIELDRQLGSIEIDILLQQRLINTMPTVDAKLIYVAKLSESKFKKKKVISSLQFYTNVTKQIQTKRFLEKPNK